VKIAFVLLNFCIVLLCLFGFQASLHAQDVEAIVKSAKKPIKISGGIGTDHVLYASEGMQNRRNAPYQYYFNGNLNIQVFKEFNLPLTFSFSNQQFNYSQPLNQQSFNQFGISPRYKWATAHIGWRSMTFSPYSLNGHTFLGGGVELTPGKWNISAMYGRLLKAVEIDSTGIANGNKPSFRRMGMGLNVKFEDNGNLYGVNFFRSKDEAGSLNAPLDSIGVTPEQNVVWGLSLKQKLGLKFKFEGEFSNSIITKDTRYSDDHQSRTLGVIRENTTTVGYDAYKAKLSYLLGKATLGLGYERVAPGYRTHGAYYFNNDLENITFNFGRPFFKNKVNFGFNIGTQRNNLDKSKLSTMRRWVGSANIAWQVSDKLNLAFTYSNFQTYTNIRSQFQIINSNSPYQLIDTLNYVQIAQAFNLNANYLLSSNDKRQQSIMFNGSVQNTADHQGGKTLASGSTFYNGSLVYGYTFVPIALSFNLAGNMNWNQSQLVDNKVYGPTVGVSKGLFKKQMTTSLAYSWNTTLNNNESTGYIGSLRFINSLNVKKKHSFTLSFIWLNRESISPTTGAAAMNEYTGRIGYNYRF
jgi:hypothetical protein